MARKKKLLAAEGGEEVTGGKATAVVDAANWGTAEQVEAANAAAAKPKGYCLIAVSDITATKDNPRHIDETNPEFLELVEDIRAQGVVVPVHVRTHPVHTAMFELMDGERRLRAAKLAGLAEIGCLDYGSITNDQAFAVTFAAFQHRPDLTPLEQGRAATILLEKYKGDAKAAASMMGKSVKWLMTHAHIDSGLSAAWKEAVSQGDGGNARLNKFTTAHLAVIAKFPEGTQARILKKIQREYWEDPTVADVREAVRRRTEAPGEGAVRYRKVPGLRKEERRKSDAVWGDRGGGQRQKR